MSFYDEERAALEELFPRGRFERESSGAVTEDDCCILRALRASHAKDHVFIQARRRLLGICYFGGAGNRYLNDLQPFVEKHLKGDDEGIIHVRWCQEAADLLSAFTLKDASNPNPDTSGLQRFQTEQTMLKKKDDQTAADAIRDTYQSQDPSGGQGAPGERAIDDRPKDGPSSPPVTP